MTESPGYQPMGNKLAGKRAVRHTAVFKNSELACPDHDDGALTASGSLYKCHYGHLLNPAVQTREPPTVKSGG
jgi:hypothetical protein